MSDRIKQLQSILEAEPDDAFCMYGLAMEYAKLGEHVQAVAWFDRTLAVDPNHCYAYFHKAKTLEEAGDATAAILTLQTGLARAKAMGDAKAMSEIAAYLGELS